VAGGFTVDDFCVDEQAGTATCPNGITRPISTSRQVTFGVACRACPLRALHAEPYRQDDRAA